MELSPVWRNGLFISGSQNDYGVSSLLDRLRARAEATRRSAYLAREKDCVFSLVIAEGMVLALGRKHIVLGQGEVELDSLSRKEESV